MMNSEQQHERTLAKVIRNLLGIIVFLILTICSLLYLLVFGAPDLRTQVPQRDASSFSALTVLPAKTTALWQAPDTSDIMKEAQAEEIRYGRALIINTAYYLGPKGIVSHQTNGMNCQNCHLEAGTKPFGNNYGSVASTYPKFKERSGRMESIYKRVSDCFERSLNGKAPDTLSAEMKAIGYYIQWLGKNVKKGDKSAGSGIENIPFLDRSADPSRGETLFRSKCTSCHGGDGQGKLNTEGTAYQYPPLWGVHSYNSGAGLYRMSRFAGFIKNNMPQGASYNATQLSNEEAWDIAAFVNSQARPAGNISKDWPRLSAKPIDNPFGPYADSFSLEQHKFGPFGPISEFKKKREAKVLASTKKS
jgi:thiosulfate dehydrogenase